MSLIPAIIPDGIPIWNRELRDILHILTNHSNAIVLHIGYARAEDVDLKDFFIEDTITQVATDKILGIQKPCSFKLIDVPRDLVAQTFSLRPYTHNLKDYATTMATCVTIAYATEKRQGYFKTERFDFRLFFWRIL